MRQGVLTMSKQVHLAVDLGAESGRVMAGVWNGKSLRLEELHRFPNGPVSLAGTLRRDVLRLLAEIQNGMALAGKKYGQNIISVAADTWGVFFALLSKNGELLSQPFHYRDARTNGIMEKAFNSTTGGRGNGIESPWKCGRSGFFPSRPDPQSSAPLSKSGRRPGRSNSNRPSHS